MKQNCALVGGLPLRTPPLKIGRVSKAFLTIFQGLLFPKDSQGFAMKQNCALVGGAAAPPHPPAKV